ncbi:hypothetical protein HN807_10320 [Candidatus Bathyarchaeota archaeon]|jgi:hypothetical protein|nr:hypothetical protein [Candidatus Bathyarchaeota archaeon]MBT4320330.1 hypothetical protein [Candidatus Bathyarchaeota archaeon]MBT4424431.1 hypothetical protein [Candidatus Bathyarchaeota archaeon]MBT5642910.1 hypothetical protein [Candidatus Bathyarchaeota archaeon]MBT6604815.1 hypothetical protein [Candidatus Bathyarchaeota archaeon]
MRTRNIITGVTAVIGGVYAVSQLGTGMFGIISGVNVAVIITIAGLFIGKRLDWKEEEEMGFKVEDERTQLIDGKASKVGFKFGNYVWLALIYYDFTAERYMPWPKFNSQEMLLFGLLFNLGIYFASMLYYRKQV